MRSLNRPEHLQSSPASQTTQSTGRSTHDEAGPRKERSSDGGITKRRIRDDRILGALCHAGIFLGLWGVVTTAVIWAYRKDRSKVLRFQGAQALVYQLCAQLLFLAAAVVGIVWAAGADGVQSALGRDTLEFLSSAGFLAGVVQLHFIPLTVLYALLGFVALLLLILCLCGLEPAYPLVGALTRKALGIRSPTRPDTGKAAKNDKKDKDNKDKNEKGRDEKGKDEKGRDEKDTQDDSNDKGPALAGPKDAGASGESGKSV